MHRSRLCAPRRKTNAQHRVANKKIVNVNLYYFFVFLRNENTQYVSSKPNTDAEQ